MNEWYAQDGNSYVSSSKKYGYQFRFRLKDGYEWAEGVAGGDFSKLTIRINGEVYNPEPGNIIYYNDASQLVIMYLSDDQKSKISELEAEVETPKGYMTPADIKTPKALTPGWTVTGMKWYEGSQVYNLGNEVKASTAFKEGEFYVAEILFTLDSGNTVVLNPYVNIKGMSDSAYTGMKGSDYSIRAIVKCAAPELYSISVSGGNAILDSSEADKSAPGRKVTLAAGASPEGKVFDRWEVITGSVTIEDVTSNITSFTMPAGEVFIKALYKDAPAGEPDKISIDSMEASLSASSYVYTGSEKRPSVTVKNGETALVEGTDYFVSYSNNKYVGTAKVTIRGIGDYTGEIEKTFKINPSKVTLSKVTKTASGKFKATWKKHSTQTTGFQIRYSTSGTFKTYKTVTVSGKSAVSKTVSKPKKGKKYYVKVRAYKTVNGTKYYGSWSARKYVRV